MAKEKKVKAKKYNSNRKGTGLVVLFILLVAIGTVVFSKMVLWPKYQDYVSNQKKIEVAGVTVKADIGEIYEMEDFTVNTFQSGGRRFANIKLALETKNEQVVEELKKRNPQIRDMMLKYFRSKTVLELTNPAFPDSSASELVDEINQILTTGEVTNLFYLDLIVQ